MGYKLLLFIKKILSPPPGSNIRITEDSKTRDTQDNKTRITE